MNSGLYIGLMSGTSVDGIDAVLVEIQAGQLRLIAAKGYAWPENIREEILTVSQYAPNQLNVAEIARLDGLAADGFADAVLQLLQQACCAADQVVAIGHPGQTVCHQPLARPPYTWQIGNPARLAHATGIPVVAQFRQSDMATGGQGAPLAPALHAAYLRSTQENRVVLNLGGIANITVLPADRKQSLLGFDTGPANALLDAWSWQQRRMSYDENGAWAAQGTVQTDLLAILLADPYFQDPPPKTTGRDYFNLNWLAQRAMMLSKPLSAFQPVDIQATLSELTAVSIAQEISKIPDCARVLGCGGGVLNTNLWRQLQNALPEGVVLDSTTEYGLPSQWVEAMCFAWFAWQRWADLPIDLTPFTGAKRPAILGGVFKP
jgi:anhydro-N-acetylmuramic acid kinase